MSIEENKEVVLNWMVAFVWCNVDRMKELSSDNFMFYAPGELPVSGRYPRDVFYGMIEGLAKAILHPITFKIGSVTAEQDRVCVEAESKAQLANGLKYNNWYHYLLTVRNGKVASVKEYADSLHLARTFLGAKVDLPAKERESVLSAVTKTIVTSS